MNSIQRLQVRSTDSLAASVLELKMTVVVLVLSKPNIRFLEVKGRW